MGFGFHTLGRAVIIGTDLGLAMVRALLEHIWLGGLVLGLCLLIYVLKLPGIFLLPLMLLLVAVLLWLMPVS
jgi:hypothetical protein